LGSGGGVALLCFYLLKGHAKHPLVNQAQILLQNSTTLGERFKATDPFDISWYVPGTINELSGKAKLTFYLLMPDKKWATIVLSGNKQGGTSKKNGKWRVTNMTIDFPSDSKRYLFDETTGQFYEAGAAYTPIDSQFWLYRLMRLPNFFYYFPLVPISIGVYFVFAKYNNSFAYHKVVGMILENPQLKQALGAPLKLKSSYEGRLGKRYASFSVDVQGSDGWGKLQIAAIRAMPYGHAPWDILESELCIMEHKKQSPSTTMKDILPKSINSSIK